MSKSYKKHPIMRWENPDYTHKEKNRHFRRTKLKDTPPNGSAYKKYKKDWSFKPYHWTKQNAIHDWELKVALDKYRNYQLAEKTKEEAIQKWEKFCHRK